MTDSDTPSSAGMEMMREPFQDTLYKFTNVMKGWQLRCFVLDFRLGQLRYYLPASEGQAETRDLSRLRPAPRGCQHLDGAMVIPMADDSRTFTIEFASGLTYKLRCSNAKHRQLWVDKIREAIALYDQQDVSQRKSSLDSLPIDNSSPARDLDKTLDACKKFHNELDRAMSKLPAGQEDKASEILLQLKAFSLAGVRSLEDAVVLL